VLLQTEAIQFSAQLLQPGEAVAAAEAPKRALPVVLAAAEQATAAGALAGQERLDRVMLELPV